MKNPKIPLFLLENTKMYLTIDTQNTINMIMMNTTKLMKLKRATMWQFRHIWWPLVPVDDTKVAIRQDKHHDVAQDMIVHRQKRQEETTKAPEVDQHHVTIAQICPKEIILELEGRHVLVQGI